MRQHRITLTLILVGELTAFVNVYETRPRKGNRGIDLASYALPFGRIWYRNPKATKYVIFSAGRIML
jgi:hypothetical protein